MNKVSSLRPETNMSENSALESVVSDKAKYEIPGWVGKPPTGSHLDVMKTDQLIQLLIDEKGVYYFGRNPIQCDFVVEHASCSRVHAVLLYHKILDKFAVVDLGSSHGTTVGRTRIDPLTPVFLELNSTFYFGASTRRYTLRSKPISTSEKNQWGRQSGNHCSEGDAVYYSSLHNLPEKQAEIDNLTEYNTAQNRRIPQVPITLEDARRKNRRRPNVTFCDDEEIINPEDVDPTVGRFRNLIRTAVIPTNAASKRPRLSTSGGGDQLFEFYSPGVDETSKTHRPLRRNDDSLETATTKLGGDMSHQYSSVSAISLNAAPNLEVYAPKTTVQPASVTSQKTVGEGEGQVGAESDAHSRKKYAKEAWPGRKPNSTTL